MVTALFPGLTIGMVGYIVLTLIALFLITSASHYDDQEKFVGKAKNGYPGKRDIRARFIPGSMNWVEYMDEPEFWDTFYRNLFTNYKKDRFRFAFLMMDVMDKPYSGHIFIPWIVTSLYLEYVLFYFQHNHPSFFSLIISFFYTHIIPLFTFLYSFLYSFFF